MNRLSTPARSRANRRLGYFALAHALLTVALAFLVLADTTFEARWRKTLLVIAVALWFVWPVVLALHPGRSLGRWILVNLLGVVLLFPALRLYNRFGADVFGLPFGINMDPVSLSAYARAYLAGRVEATKDIAAGVFVIEEAGFGAGAGADAEILKKRYKVELRAIAGCLVDETIMGHLTGYNSVSEPEIYRRFGRDKIEAAREEGHQIAMARMQAFELQKKDLARRFTALPPGSALILGSVAPFYGGDSYLPPDVEGDLEAFVRSVEQFVMARVPKDAPDFELHISASLGRSKRPQYETSGTLSIPRTVYDPIYKEIPDLPVPEWTHGDLSVSLDFANRQKL